MKQIELSRGYFALIDDDDFDRVSAHAWHVRNNYDRGMYATTNLKISSSPRKYETLSMHRFIMRANTGEVIDHANRNGLDNRKENLRVATRSTNAANSKHRADRSTSPYRGVYKEREKYRAQIRVEGKLHHLGRFVCPMEAAMAYDYAAGHFFGEFAVKNNPFEEDRRGLL